MGSCFGSGRVGFGIDQFKRRIGFGRIIVAIVVGLHSPIQVVGHTDIDVVVIQTLYSVYIEHLQKKCRSACLPIERREGESNLPDSCA